MQALVRKVGIAIAILLVGIAIGRFATPTKVKVIETEVVVEKVVEKKVLVKEQAKTKEVDKTRIVTTIHKPDGTKITKEVETDKESTKKIAKEQDSQEKETSTEKTITRFVERYRPTHQYKLDLLGRYNQEQKMDYGVMISTRVQGPMTAGVWGLYKTEGKSHEDKKFEFGFSLGLEF